MRTELQDWFDRYTEPAHDGTKQAVKGRGQTDLIGATGDTEAFAQDLSYLRDSGPQGVSTTPRSAAPGAVRIRGLHPPRT